jgi:mono/diheme cytochrome c family protein
MCVRCHGADGTGTETRTTSPSIPNFTDPTWQAKRTGQQLAVSILDGKGTRMPSFRGRLTDTDAQDLVAFIRTKSPTPSQPAESPPTDFEQRYRQLKEEFSDLQKEARKLAPDRSD